MSDSKYLMRALAAKYVTEKFGIPCSPKTLGKLATLGGGPEFRKIGRTPVYETPDLDAWVASRTGPLVNSTSGFSGPAARQGNHE
jgi:hypothetical protein